MRRLAAMVPTLHLHLIRFHVALAANVQLRRAVLRWPQELGWCN